MQSRDRDLDLLRDVIVRMYWDGEASPSVEVPLGEFFGLGHGKYYNYDSLPLAIGNSKGLNCYFPMPFRTAARVILRNDTDKNAMNYSFVEWEPLPAVVTSADAIAAGAVAVWDACASNVAVETQAGDAAAADAAFARAAHVVTLDTRINRVTGVPMEPRAAVGDFDGNGRDEAFYLCTGCHGTALVKALTGIDADRLKEEKARGITIDLGFAYWPQDNGDVIGFVDVPGHERFVHTMVAGASGVDFVMLVVAADDARALELELGAADDGRETGAEANAEAAAEMSIMSSGSR